MLKGLYHKNLIDQKIHGKHNAVENDICESHLRKIKATFILKYT